jgi:hypothetical protein
VVGAACALVVSILWRVGSAALNPYSWLVLPPSLVALAAAALVRRRTT